MSLNLVFQVAIFVALAFFATPRVATVNVGPPSSGGHVVGEPVGIQNIDIAREALSIDLRPLARDGLAQVEAIYQLDNRGQEQTLDLLFAGGSKGVKDFQVWLDETPVTAAPARDAVIPESWQPPPQTPGIAGGRPLDYWFYGASRLVPMGFTISIPSGPHALKVRYVAEPTKHFYGYPTVYWQFAYVLAPAKSWAGFGGLDVEIQLPEDWKASCTPRLIRDGDCLKGRFDDLPADAIALTVQAPEGSAYGIVLYGSLALFGLVLIGGVGFCGWRGRSIGQRLASLVRDGAPPPLAWPRALGLAGCWSLAILVTGLIAIFAPEYSLPTDQVSHYGYGRPLAILGLFFLTVGALPVGFSIVYLTTTHVRLQQHNLPG